MRRALIIGILVTSLLCGCGSASTEAVSTVEAASTSETAVAETVDTVVLEEEPENSIESDMVGIYLSDKGDVCYLAPDKTLYARNLLHAGYSDTTLVTLDDFGKMSWNVDSEGAYVDLGSEVSQKVRLVEVEDGVYISSGNILGTIYYVQSEWGEYEAYRYLQAMSAAFERQQYDNFDYSNYEGCDKATIGGLQFSVPIYWSKVSDTDDTTWAIEAVNDNLVMGLFQEIQSKSVTSDKFKEAMSTLYLKADGVRSTMTDYVINDNLVYAWSTSMTDNGDSYEIFQAYVWNHATGKIILVELVQNEESIFDYSGDFMKVVKTATNV